MALVHADFVEETTATTGTGALTLAGATTGHRTFLSAIGNGNECVYAIVDASDAWEVGRGVVGAGTLSRDTLIESSTGSVLNLTAGTHTVYCTFSSEGAALAYETTRNLDGGAASTVYTTGMSIDGGSA